MNAEIKAAYGAYYNTNKQIKQFKTGLLNLADKVESLQNQKKIFMEDMEEAAKSHEDAIINKDLEMNQKVN